MVSYKDLGVVPLINGIGPATRLGGLPLTDDVWDAMREALAISVRMDELQVGAGRRIAELLDAPDAYVTSGASAALAMATAAIMTQGEPALIDRLPDATGIRDEVIVQASHRDPYDRAIESVGAKIVVAGYPGSTHIDEVERLVGDRTAAILYRPGAVGDLVGLPRLAAIGETAGVPVIVDGALVIPPISRVAELFAAGATAIAVSGGKGLRGPQSTGLLLATPEVIANVGLLHWDMDELTGTWRNPHPAASQPYRSTVAPPRHGIARSMKVGREQIMGMLAALERYVRQPGDDEASGIVELAEARAMLQQLDGLSVADVDDTKLNVPTLVLYFDGPDRARDVAHQLRDGTPRIFLGEDGLTQGHLQINPMALLPGDGVKIAERISQIVADVR